MKNYSLILAAVALTNASLWAQNTPPATPTPPANKEKKVQLTFDKIIDQFFISRPVLKGEDSLLFVEAKINGKDSLFLIDTGASSILLDLPIAKEHEIKLTQIGKASDVYQKGGKVYDGVVKSINLGDGIEIKNQKIHFLNLSSIKEYKFPDGKKRQIAGIIGLGFFNSAACSIDYPNSRILVAKKPINGGLSGLHKQIGYRHIKLHQEPDGRHYVLTELKGKPAYFLVDTGSNINVIYPSIAKSHGYKIIDGKGKITTISGKSGKIQLATVPLVTIEKIRLPNMSMHVIPSGGDAANIGEIPVVGILGGGLLDTLKVTIDFQTKEMTMALGR